MIVASWIKMMSMFLFFFFFPCMGSVREWDFGFLFLGSPLLEEEKGEEGESGGEM